MIDKFDEKFSKALKSQAENIKPEPFLLANIIKKINVTPMAEQRYSSRKGRLSIINELMNQKLKVLLPLAAIVLVVAGGLAYQANHSLTTPSDQNNSATQSDNSQVSSEATDNPDQIYNQLISDSSDEQTIANDSSSSDLSDIDRYNQSLQELNNAYDENQF